MDKCGNCIYFEKVGRRSGFCQYHYVEVENTKTKEIQARYPVVFEYHVCKSHEEKQNG